MHSLASLIKKHVFFLLTVSCVYFLAVESKSKLPKDVIVVGAGIAGLAAARKIAADKENFTVTVFEARKERYGGRAWTDKLTNRRAIGFEVDLGGSALNVASKNNPLIKLAEEFELKTAPLENLQLLVPWEGKSYDGAELNDVLKESTEILGRALNESRSSKIDISVKDAVDKVLEKGQGSNPDSPASHLVRCLPSYVLQDYSAFNYRAEALDFGYDRVLLEGIGELVDRIVSGGEDEPPIYISLGKVVRQIKVDEEKKKVVIRTHDGLQTTADAVVVAVPASVIAARDVLFEPELPKKYRHAFEEISVSSGGKVIIEFEHAFWPSEFGVFLRAVKTEEERGSLQSWINIDKIVGKPALASFVMGGTTAKFEELSDEKAQEEVMAALIEMFGEETVKKGGNVTRIQRTEWVTDVYSKGGSSYPKVGADPKLWDVLAEPVCPYIYFAGEHTSFEDHGSLHGAYNSGVRAADQIFSKFCVKKQKEEERRKKLEKKRQEKLKNESEGVNREDESNVNDSERKDEL